MLFILKQFLCTKWKDGNMFVRINPALSYIHEREQQNENSRCCCCLFSLIYSKANKNKISKSFLLLYFFIPFHFYSVTQKASVSCLFVSFFLRTWAFFPSLRFLFIFVAERSWFILRKDEAKGKKINWKSRYECARKKRNSDVFLHIYAVWIFHNITYFLVILPWKTRTRELVSVCVMGMFERVADLFAI